MKKRVFMILMIICLVVFIGINRTKTGKIHKIGTEKQNITKEGVSKEDQENMKEEEGLKKENNKEDANSKPIQAKTNDIAAFMEAWKKVIEDNNEKTDMEKADVNIYPFSKVVGEEIKVGYREPQGAIVVPAIFDKGYEVNSNFISIVCIDNLYYSFDVMNKVKGETGYQELYFVDESIELGLIDGDGDGVLIINDIKKNIKKKIHNVVNVRRGVSVEHLSFGGITVQLKNDEKFSMQIPGYERYVPFKRDVVIEAMKYGNAKELNKYTHKGLKDIGKGVIAYFEDTYHSGDGDTIRAYVIENLKTGKKTRQIYHSVLRIDDNKIFAVVSDGFQILDNNFNIKREGKVDYYGKYYKKGETLIGEDYLRKIYIDLQGNVLWEDNIEKVYEDKNNHYIRRRDVTPLSSIEWQVFLSEKDKKINEFIESKILATLDGGGIVFDIENQREMWHSYNTASVKKFKGINTIYMTRGGRNYGGGLGHSSRKVFYVTDSGEELSKEDIFIDGYEEELEKIVMSELKDFKELFEVNPLVLFYDEGVILRNSFVARGAGYWTWDIELPLEKIKHIINQENEIMKRILE